MNVDMLSEKDQETKKWGRSLKLFCNAINMLVQSLPLISYKFL